jgi:hypothetical protein
MPEVPFRRSVLRAGLALLALAAGAAPAAPALADDAVVATTTADSVQECRAPVFSQPFLSLKDDRDYVLAPGGDFSDPAGAGWQLSGGARIVDDGGAGGRLYMPSRSVAVSPVMCVDMSYPTARMWAQTLSGDGDVHFAVSYAGTRSELEPKEVGHVKGDHGRWKLSGDVKIKPELGGKHEGWRKVAFVLTADDKGAFQVDDVYVDPRMSH